MMLVEKLPQSTLPFPGDATHGSGVKIRMLEKFAVVQTCGAKYTGEPAPCQEEYLQNADV
jgi:hypothetical protein